MLQVTWPKIRRSVVGLVWVMVFAVIAQPASAITLFGTATAGLVSIDLNTNAVNTVLSLGAQPDGLLFDSSGRIIYTLLAGQVRRFDPNTNTDELLAGGLSTPADLVLEPGGQSILVSEFSGGRIDRINLNTKALTTLLSPGGNPEGLAYDNQGRLFANLGTRNGGVAGKFVAQINPVTGSILNASTGLNSLDGMTFDPFTGKIYSASLFGNLIYALDPNNLSNVSTVAVGVGLPDGVVADGQGNLFIASRSDFHVYQFDLTTNTLSQKTFVAGIDDLAPASGLGASNNTVPEPITATLGLMGLGVLGMATRRRAA